MAKKEAFLQFLKAARSLQDRGLSKEAIVQFAKNEFGELSELFKKQIDSLFKPKKGIENIKLKDEVFDDTVVKMQFDDSGVPFNPKNPLKTKSLTYEEAIAREEAKAAADEDYIMKVFDPEDFAKGGRAGLYTGGMVDVEPNLSDIGHGSDALMARTRLVSPDGQATTSTGLNYLLAEDNDNIRVPFANGNGVADEDAEKAALGKRVRELMDEGFDMGEAVKKAMSEGYAEGGRIGYNKGKAVTKGLSYLMDLFKPKPKVIFDEKRFREGPVTTEFLENINKKDLEPFIRSRDTMGPGGYGMYNDFADMPSGLQAAELISRIKGPRNTINYEAAEMFIGKKLKGNESVNELIEMLVEKKAEGGRIGFSKGKLADVARRKFMKTAGAAGAGLAALKTGLLGFGEKVAPVAKEVIETVSETAQGVPPYFLNLVNKIRKMGESTLATKDKANAYKFKDYVMEEDFAGNIEIIKKGDDVAEDVYMSYKVDDVPVKGKNKSSKVEEYEEFTARPDGEGKMKDIEQGVPDEVVQEGTMFEDNLSDFGKADGGRIGYSKAGFVADKTLKGLSYLKELFRKKDYLERFPRVDIKKLMQGDEPIKLYSGVGDRQANTLKAYKEDAKFFNTTVDKIKKDNFKGQWFTPFKEYASSFGNPRNIKAKMLTTELTPREIRMAKRYVDKVNKKDKMVSTMKMRGMDNPPKYNITTSDNTVIIPKIKLKKLKEEGKINTDYMVLDKIKSKLGLAEGGVAGILGE